MHTIKKKKMLELTIQHKATTLKRDQHNMTMEAFMYQHSNKKITIATRTIEKMTISK